jgi:hypothetical protein
MKRNVKQRQGGWHRVLALAVPLVLLGTGCDPDDNPPAPDAGTSCEDLAHDAKLGTLQLQPGFTAMESVALTPQIVAVTAMPSSNGYTLYGLRGSDKSLYSLGIWPSISAGGQALISVISESDRNETTFLSGYLTHDGTRLLSGYTKSGANFPGSVVVYDTVTPSNSTYLSAPGNFSAAAVSGTFLINGTGLGNFEGTAVYAMKVGSPNFTLSTLATFPNPTAASGYSAVSSNGVAVLGYSAYPKNTLHAVPPSVYTAALSSRTSFALGDWPEVYSGEDLFAAAGFGSGVALHRGSFDPETFAPLTKDVVRRELTLGGNPETVTVGAPTSVLTTRNTCTQVDLVTSMGADLLVGVADKNGRRLVRLQKQ